GPPAVPRGPDGPRRRPPGTGDQPGSVAAPGAGRGPAAQRLPGGVPPARAGEPVVPGDGGGARNDRGDGPLAGLQGPAETNGSPGASAGQRKAMNCDLCQRRLLAAAEPLAPPGDVAAHVAGCPACRDWQRQLAQIENQVLRLPVPESDARARLVARILREPVPAPMPATLPLRPARWRAAGVFVGVAAALVAVF